MGGAVSCVAMSASWCFCTAMGSLLTSCCGNDKDSTIPPGASSGRKRSVFLLFISIGIAFLFQYGIGSYISKYRNDFGPFAWIGNAFYDGCGQYVTDDDDVDLQTTCAEQTGVYRASASSFVFFIMFAFAAYCKPTFNREAWIAKYTLYIFLVIGSLFIPNEPVFLPIFVNIFRSGAVLYMIFNQLIILDICFNLNESWVEKADQADIEEGLGAGKKWLGALISLCVVLYIASFTSIGLMYAFFGGCGNNIAFITVTLVMGLVCTVIQLISEEASLFTSASIFAYATYLLYTAVSKNPNEQCNPQLGQEDIAGVILGVGLTFIGLIWTGFSQTAHKTVGDESDGYDESNDDNEGESKTEGTTGVALGDATAREGYGSINEERESKDDSPSSFSDSWKLNVILAAICCWYAMVLTSWGSIASNGSVANPSAGEAGMWMVIASQWLIYLLYLWTLLAPKIFTDRDFS